MPMSEVKVPYVMDNDYFHWLCSLVEADDERRPYIYLMRELFETEFSDETTILIPHDDNRIEEGLAIRRAYLDDHDGRGRKHIVLVGPCSLLEVMIALAYRMEEIISSYDYIVWFWEMIANLELLDYDDDRFKNLSLIEEEMLGTTICRLLTRTYDRNGDGSLFPMNHAKRDMRKTELWYQMNNYLVERYM